MNFNSAEFLIFYPIVLLLHFLLQHQIIHHLKNYLHKL